MALLETKMIGNMTVKMESQKWHDFAFSKPYGEEDASKAESGALVNTWKKNLIFQSTIS